MRSVLLSVLLILPVFPQARAQQPQGSTAQTDKMAAKIMKIGTRANVTVKLYDGKTLSTDYADSIICVICGQDFIR